MPHSPRAICTGLCALALFCGSAAAQDGITTGAGVPEWVKKLAIDPQSPAAQRYAQHQKVRVANEKELRKLRVKHFGPIRKEEIRQEGLLKLREYTDPALFPSLIEIFGREQLDVRLATLDIFEESRSHEGDTALTWVGIFDEKPEVRAAAISRLRKRIKTEGETPDGVRQVCFEGIRSGKIPAMASSANLAVELQMLEAIPWLINAQVSAPQQQGSGVGSGEREGAMAWILVGTQIAFVSDVTPVVGPGAVAFDPQLSVVTEGVILRVFDAVVISYNVDIHNALQQLGSAAMDGQNLAHLGWNTPAWKEWYSKEFLPYQAKKAAAAQAAAASGKG
jgi:hypothetical protein